MNLQDLSSGNQDYLKALWDLSERSGGKPASLGELARQLRQKTSTVSEATKRLAAKGLLHHTPYSAIEFTELGRRLAIEVVRRHRLMETFLVETLGYTWDEVHDDADQLEHACSEKFLNRIDELLGHPTRDPHGDPIPSSAGEIEDVGTRTLGQASAGDTVTVERLSDTAPELLRFANAHGLLVGARVTVLCAPGPDGHGLRLDVGGQEVTVSLRQAALITVR